MRVTHLNAKLAAIALALMCGLGPAAEPAWAPIKIGMPSNMFRDVPPAMFQALSTPFHNLVHSQTGLKLGGLVLVPTPDEMQFQLQTGRIQFGVFFGFEFAWMQQKSQGLQPLMVASPVHRPLQAFLIVHATSLAKSLADLKGQTLRRADRHPQPHPALRGAGVAARKASPSRSTSDGSLTLRTPRIYIAAD